MLAIAEPAQGPTPDVPELASLQYLIGTFETQVEAPFRTKGRVKGEWIHGGRFLKQTPYDHIVFADGTSIRRTGQGERVKGRRPPKHVRRCWTL